MQFLTTTPYIVAKLLLANLWCQLATHLIVRVISHSTHDFLFCVCFMKTIFIIQLQQLTAMYPLLQTMCVMLDILCAGQLGAEHYPRLPVFQRACSNTFRCAVQLATSVYSQYIIHKACSCIIFSALHLRISLTQQKTLCFKISKYKNTVLNKSA